MSNLKISLPIYVTRKNVHGETATYSQSAWLTIFGILGVSLNVIAWSAVGLIVAAKVVVGWL